jgi:hypothetical protein
MVLHFDKQPVRDFLRNYYTDARLAELLAHLQDGKFNYSSCCCFIGCATSDHELQTIDRMNMSFHGTWGDHLNEARRLSGADSAECAVLCMGNGDDKPRGNARRSRILIPMVRAEMKRRERTRQQSEWKQELVEMST